jgi:hypothetical protein
MTSRRRPPPAIIAMLAATAIGTGGAGRELAARLHPWTRGSHSGLFAGPTTTPPAGHLVVLRRDDQGEAVLHRVVPAEAGRLSSPSGATSARLRPVSAHGHAAELDGEYMPSARPAGPVWARLAGSAL